MLELSRKIRPQTEVKAKSDSSPPTLTVTRRSDQEKWALSPRTYGDAWISHSPTGLFYQS